MLGGKMEGRECKGFDVRQMGGSAWGPWACGADRVKRPTQVSNWGNELMA